MATLSPSIARQLRSPEAVRMFVFDGKIVIDFGDPVTLFVFPHPMDSWVHEIDHPFCEVPDLQRRHGCERVCVVYDDGTATYYDFR